MNRKEKLETLHELAAIALTIDELRDRRHKADINAPVEEPYVKVQLLYGEINVVLSRDRDDSTHIYSTDPAEKTIDGSIDDAVKVMTAMLGELSEYADD